jgi:zinc/manganese transport system substrate-binding protein
VVLLALTALPAVGLGSCAIAPGAQTETHAPNQTSPTTAALKVVTTTLPITDFTNAVVGDRVPVTYLLPTNIGPHDYQAKPEDVRTIAQATVLVKNGLGLEDYLDDLVHNADNPALTVIDSSNGITPISNAEFEGRTAEQKPTTRSDAPDGGFNPHIWLDPERAIQQVETIRDGLIAVDPAGKEVYTANASAYIDKLKALDTEIASTLHPYAGKEFVTYHDFAPYFAQRYNLKAEFLVGVPEENPSPGDVKRVINAAQKSDLKTLLTEPQAAGNPFAAVADDLKIQISTFDPMETSGPEGVTPEYYITVMRQNVNNLKIALSEASAQADRSGWFAAFQEPSVSGAIATMPLLPKRQAW